MSNAQFKKNFAKLMKKAGNKCDAVVRASVLDLGRSIVLKSPVDTGRFRGNWQYGVNQINYAADSGADRSGAGSIGRIATGLSSFAPGQTINITNSLPYALRLENGWSQQAPGGMVRLSVVEWRQMVNKAARAIKDE